MLKKNTQIKVSQSLDEKLQQFKTPIIKNKTKEEKIIVKTKTKKVSKIKKVIKKTIKKKDTINTKNTKDIKKINTKKTQNTQVKSYYQTLDLNSKSSLRDGFSEGLLEASKKDENIVVLCADLKESLKVDAFADKYPNRFYEFGIAEQNMASAAAGMCIINKVPIICSYAAFNPGRNFDQIRTSICYSNANVKILGGHAGLTTGPDGATHQMLEDIALMRVLPNMVVLIPCDKNQAKAATIAAFKHKGPVYIRLTREKSLDITNNQTKFEIGKAQVLDDGIDATIIATGLTVQFALEAKSKLLEQSINVAVINLSTIKPFDEKTILQYAKKTKAIVTIEEHQVAGGMGSLVSEFLSKNYPVPIEIIGVEDSFGQSGEGYELLEKYNISTIEIIKRVKKVISRKN